MTKLATLAGLFNPPRTRRPKRAGRPRLVGKRLPKLQQRLQSKRTSWTKLTVNHWYGAVARQVEYVSGTAIWYHGGFKPLPIRWVLIRDRLSRLEPLAPL